MADDIDAELRVHGNPERAVHERAYLKSSLDHYGASVPAIRRTAKAALGASELDHDELVELVSLLWASTVHERRMAAVELLDMCQPLLRFEDVPLLERMLRESRTWALVDPLAARVVGPLVEREPRLSDVLDRWAGDDDFWVRRAALLTLLGPLRRGEGDWARFTRFAEGMLGEREFFIQKAIGWVLRDTARRRPGLVFDWLLSRAARVSAVTIREAVKPLTDVQRAEVAAARCQPLGRSGRWLG